MKRLMLIFALGGLLLLPSVGLPQAASPCWTCKDSTDGTAVCKVVDNGFDACPVFRGKCINDSSDDYCVNSPGGGGSGYCYSDPCDPFDY